MARSRNIKPGFFKNEVLGVADPLFSLLFEGLWVLADRAGRLEDRPMRIKGEIFPYRDGLDMEAMLNWLQANEFIKRYTVAGKRFILVVEFVKHQNPHKNEAESEIPAPEEIGTKPEIIGTTRADSLSSDSLSSDSLIPHTPFGVEVGTSVPAFKTTKPEYPPMFDEFWTAYPKKVGKDAAAKAFGKRKPDRELVQAMVQAIRDQKHSEAWKKQDGQFIPNPATWLNDGRWKDGTADTGNWAAKPAWVVEAGFEDVADAHSSRCYEHNAAQFQNGKRLEAA